MAKKKFAKNITSKKIKPKQQFNTQALVLVRGFVQGTPKKGQKATAMWLSRGGRVVKVLNKQAKEDLKRRKK